MAEAEARAKQFDRSASRSGLRMLAEEELIAMSKQAVIMLPRSQAFRGPKPVRKPDC